MAVRKPEIVSGNITNNIMHDDQMQHGRAVEADFLINSVANTEGKLAKFVGRSLGRCMAGRHEIS